MAVFCILHTLKESDFPHDLQAEWRWVLKELTKSGPMKDSEGKVLVGSVENTMKKIRNSTGSKIASRIYELYWAVSKNSRYE